MMTPAPDSATSGQNPEAAYVDPRDTPAFKEVNSLVHNFIESFPKGYKDPVRNGVVDVHLLTAILAPNLYVKTKLHMKGILIVHYFRGIILLHDPHVDLQRRGCISVQEVNNAAHNILNQLYAIWSTSFDMARIDNFSCVCYQLTYCIVYWPNFIVCILHLRKSSDTIPRELQGEGGSQSTSYI